MGPIALFDKSFLQSLSVDESVWFAHFFSPVVCPLFYVETLADLEKAVREGRTPEQEVGIIASKFPESSAVPLLHHNTLATNDLYGNHVPMTGQIPMARGRIVNVDGKRGVVYDESPEAQAFSRWQEGNFLDVERGTAKLWRAMLAGLNLERIAENLRAIGIDQSTCKSLDEARTAVERLAAVRDKGFERLTLALLTLQVPGGAHEGIFERFAATGNPPLSEFAPYASHVLSVEMFFQFALAAKLIGAERASNRIDVAYLNYTPFCHVLISSDRLQQRCAPYFLAGNHQFVWGEDLKRDLAQINTHFSQLPEAERDRGIMAFANRPPETEHSIVRRLWAKYLRPGMLEEKPRKLEPRDPEADKKLIEHLQRFTRAPAESTLGEGEFEMLAIQRKVRKKRGSWYQVPKDLKTEAEDEGT